MLKNVKTYSDIYCSSTGGGVDERAGVGRVLVMMWDQCHGHGPTAVCQVVAVVRLVWFVCL